MSRKLSQNQKTFNRVARHLLKQNAKSRDEDGYCMYRGIQNRRCGIGALIPNRLYRTTMETLAADCDPVAPVLQSLGHNATFCSSLQSIHDLYSETDWPNKLKEFAKKHGLKMPA